MTALPNSAERMHGWKWHGASWMAVTARGRRPETPPGGDGRHGDAGERAWLARRRARVVATDTSRDRPPAGLRLHDHANSVRGGVAPGRGREQQPGHSSGDEAGAGRTGP